MLTQELNGSSCPTPRPVTITVKFDFFASPTETRRRKRPRAERVAAPLKVLWRWGPVEQKGVLRDISTGGCFIETAAKVAPGDTIQFRLSVPKLLHMEMAGMVVRRRRGEGFALRFKRLSAVEQALLERAVKHLRLHMMG
jgi:PilZ domain